MQFINSKKAPKAIGPYSQAVVINDIIYTSGQIPINPESGLVECLDIESQTLQVIENLANILEEVGSSLNKVIKTTVFISDMDNFSLVNKIYSKYFTTNPARSCVEVSRLPKDVLIEIEAIASLK